MDEEEGTDGLREGLDQEDAAPKRRVGGRFLGCLVLLLAWTLLGVVESSVPGLFMVLVVLAAGWCFGIGIEAAWQSRGKIAFQCSVGATFFGLLGGVAIKPIVAPFAVAAGVLASFVIRPPAMNER